MLAMPGMSPGSELHDLTPFSRQLMKEWKTPGLAVVVIRDGKKIYTKGFGVESIDARRRVGTDTLFPLASLTKTFCSVLAAMLVADGTLGWDTPVGKILPKFRIRDPLVTGQCTLKDLLSHRSGIGRRDGLWYRRGLDAGELLTRLAILKPKQAFRDRFEYSNMGYMLAGLMEAHAAGLSWNLLLSRRILQTLGMPATTIGPPRPGADHRAVPHLLGSGRRPFSIPPVTELALAPAFGLWSNADDLGTWLQFLLDPNHRALISREEMEKLWTPILPMPGLTFPEIPMKAYGMGWMISSYRGRRLLFHTGRGAGSSSIIALLPGENLGIVVLSNISNSRAPEILAWRIVDLLLKLPPIDWKSRLWAEEEEIQNLEAAQNRRLTSMEARGQIPANPPREFAGAYSNPAYGELQIETEENGQLSLHFRDLVAPVLPLRGEIFLAEFSDDPHLKQVALEFVHGSTHPKGIILRLDGESVLFNHDSSPKEKGQAQQPAPRISVE